MRPHLNLLSIGGKYSPVWILASISNLSCTNYSGRSYFTVDKADRPPDQSWKGREDKGDKYCETTPYLHGSNLRLWARLQCWEKVDHEDKSVILGSDRNTWNGQSRFFCALYTVYFLQFVQYEVTKHLEHYCFWSNRHFWYSWSYLALGERGWECQPY